ncbi:MAG: hypothetical protein ACK5LX_10250 [Oscillospiraceae bacterium]
MANNNPISQAEQREQSTATQAAGTQAAPAQKAKKSQLYAGYTQFAYIGPSVPRHGLNEGRIFTGSYEDIRKHLGDFAEKCPQAMRLIVPVNMLAREAQKGKKPDTALYSFAVQVASFAASEGGNANG